MGKVKVDQKRYIEIMLELFQIDQSTPSRSPADLQLKLQTTRTGDKELDQKIYRSLVGSFLYLAKQTPSVTMFIVNILSRHMNSHTNQHWLCIKRLLRYLQGSKSLKRTYTKEASYDFVGSNEEEWSDEEKDRISTTGYYAKLNGICAAPVWGVGMKATVFFSSEAENQCMSAGSQEAIYLKQILEGFSIQEKYQITIG